MLDSVFIEVHSCYCWAIQQALCTSLQILQPDRCVFLRLKNVVNSSLVLIHTISVRSVLWLSFSSVQSLQNRLCSVNVILFIWGMWSLLLTFQIFEIECFSVLTGYFYLKKTLSILLFGDGFFHFSQSHWIIFQVFCLYLHMANMLLMSKLEKHLWIYLIIPSLKLFLRYLSIY